jgi:hypothetical protein
MAKEVLFKKGYHLEVESWENDADNFATKRLFVGDDEKTAIALMTICKELFSTYHSGEKIGIGNMMDDDYDKAGQKCVDYFSTRPEAREAMNTFYKTTIDFTENDEVYDMIVADFNGDIMGSSEWYCSRVFNSARVIYAPEDVEIDVVAKSSRR